MKYLCLGYFDKKAMDAKTPAEMDQLMQQCGPHMDALYQTNQVLVDAGLANDTKSARREKGRVVVTDGPFTETKDMLGGVFIVEAPNFDDAVRVALLHPTTKIEDGEAVGWRLEVRPIHYFKE